MPECKPQLPGSCHHQPPLCPPGSLLPVLGPERPPPTQLLPPGPSHLRTQDGLPSCFHPGVPVLSTRSSRLCPLWLIHAFGSQPRCHLLRPQSKGPWASTSFPLLYGLVGVSPLQKVCSMKEGPGCSVCQCLARSGCLINPKKYHRRQ